MKALRVLLLLACCALASATPGQPMLIPIDPDLAAFGPGQPYRLAVQRHLLGNRVAGFGVLVFPSFSTEWAVQIVHDRGQPLVLQATMDTSLGAALQWGVEQEGASEVALLATLRIPVTRRWAPLPSSTATVIASAWKAMLSAAAPPSQTRRLLDGTSYLFFAASPRGAHTVALTRSPERGTPALALVELLGALRHHVESSGGDPAASDADLLRRARDVQARVDAQRQRRW